MNCRGRYYIQMAEDHRSKGLGRGGGGGSREMVERNRMEAEDRGMKWSHPGHSSQARRLSTAEPHVSQLTM